MESKTDLTTRFDIDAAYHDLPEKSGEVEIFIPELIISGCQRGADLGGLLGVQACGIATGGIAPRGWRTETGSYPEMQRLFGMVESESHDYAARTIENINLAEVIILIASNFMSPGTKLTKRAGAHLPIFEVTYPKLPSLENEFLIGDIRSWLWRHKPAVVMIAGNRESVCPGIEQWTSKLIQRIFKP